VAGIGKVLPCKVHHGIFEIFLDRTLLWERSGEHKTRKIEYEASNVPSWSWMAYERGIEFVHDTFGSLDLIKDLIFDEQALTATVWEFTDLGMKIDAGNGGMRYQILDSKGSKKGWISLEEETELSAVRNVVVVAMHARDYSDNCQYFVLVVRPTKS